jgi:hypothetical protein
VHHCHENSSAPTDNAGQMSALLDAGEHGPAVRMPQASEPVIERGTCYALFVYDIGLSIDLDEAERRVSSAKQRDTLKHTHRAPRYFEYRPAPVRVTQRIEPLPLGTCQSSTTVDLVLYDFGAVLVVYSIPLAGPLGGLLALSEALDDNTPLLADSRKRTEELCAAIRSAVAKPEISQVVEDYAIFHIEAFTAPYTADLLCNGYAQAIAQILRAERQVLSEHEVREVLSYRMSYGTEDVTIIDWNAALMCDREGEDVRTVLEFANVELLEMRYLDQLLDDALDKSYRTLSTRRWRPLSAFGTYRTDLQWVAQLQVDSAVLFEGVNNVLKLLGDQYLARVYRLISQRVHLAEWDASILRKLDTLESIYEKMSDQGKAYRMEILEWIIIILITVSIVLPFLPGGYGH